MKATVLFLVLLISLSHSTYSQKALALLTFHGGFGDATGQEAKLSSGIGADFDFELSDRVRFNLMPTLNARGYTGLVVVKTTYIDVPVSFEFSLDDSPRHMFIGVGGYMGYALKGKYKNILSTTGNTDWQQISFGEETTDNRSNTDYGVLLSIGAFIPQYRGTIKAGIQIMHGLKNVVPKDRQDEPTSNDIKLRNITAYVAFSLFNKK